MPRPKPAIGPVEPMSFCSVGSVRTYPAASPAYTFSRVMPHAWSW